MHLQIRLNFIIVRPAIVYGVGDRLGLTPRLIIGAVYAHLKEKMKVCPTRYADFDNCHFIIVVMD